MIRGEGGGAKGDGAEEYPNTLRARNLIRVIEIISEGEIEGPGVNDDWEQSIQLSQGTPIKGADGKYNFKGVSIVTRSGLPDQSYMEGFPAAETPFTVGVEVKNGSPGPVTRRITTPNVNAVRVAISTPALAKQDDDGNTVGSSFEFKIEVKADADDPGSAWVEKVHDAFTGKTTSEYQRSYRIGLTGGAPYDIRVTRITPDSEKTTNQNKSSWELYTEIIDRKLTFPDTALVGLTLNAELFGTSFPDRGYLIKGIKISIPSNYDPVARTYTGEWDGTFTTAWTNNPAWVLYDLITNNRYGCGDWFAAATVDKWGLYQLAQYCDAWHERVDGTTEDYDTLTGKNGVKDGRGGYEPRFTINVTISSREQAYKVLDAVAGMMRTTLLWAGGLISFIQDRPKDSTRLFNQTNVINGEFVYAGSALSARHTVCTVSWNDPAQNYALDTIMVEDREGIQRYGYNQVDIAAYGCTSYGQAYRAALFTLYTERLETDTVKFSIGLDNADILPGEIIKIADPKLTEAAHGGRLFTIAAGGGTMDRPFAFTPGVAYTITAVTMSGDIVIRTINNPGVTTNTFTVTEDFDAGDMPLIGALFVIESDEVQHRLFRVISVTENQNTADVQALEYNAEKFTQIDNDILTVIEKPDFSDLPTPTSIAPPETLRLSYSIKLISGIQHGELRIDWSAVTDPYLLHYRVSYQIGDGDWHDLPATVNLSTVLMDPDITSIVRVVVFSVSNTGLVSQANAAVLNLGTLATVLNKPAIYDLQIAGGGSAWSGRDVYLQWTSRSPYAAAPDVDGTGDRLVSGADPIFKHFRVEVYDSTGVSLLGSFITYTNDFTIPEERLRAWGAARAYRVKVVFVDRIDADSAPATLDITNPAPALPDVTITRNADTISMALTQPSDPDFLGYRVWMSQASPVATTAENIVWDGAGAPTLPAETNTTYYARYAALDVWGETGAIISSEIEITPVELDNITDFDAYPGEDRLRFVWGQVDTNTSLDYEVREGETWATGIPFPRISGNTLVVQRAVSEAMASTFWIKAFTRDGRAESPVARSVVVYQEPTTRNQIFEQDESLTDWPGAKINMTVVGSGSGSYLQLDAPGGIRAPYGDYINEIDLGDTFYARNWVETSFGRLTNVGLTWQDWAGGISGTNTWQSLGATTWAPQAEPTDGATLDVKIAVELVPSDLIEGWALRSDTTGVKGTLCDAPANLTLAPCYNDYGQEMGDGSHMGWDLTALTTPAMSDTFSLLVNVQPVDGTPAINPPSMRIAEFSNGSDYLALEWSSATGNFTLIDGTNTVTLAAPTWTADNPIVVGIVQTGAERRLFYYDLYAEVGDSASGAFTLAWTPERLDLGGAYDGVATWSDLSAVTWASLAALGWDELLDITKETEAVFGNAEIRTTLYSYADFVEAARTRAPAGYGAWRPFLAGDYSYQRALVWARLAATPDATGDITLNELWTFSDLPDLTDRGTVAVSGAGSASVTFNRTFHATPEISITQVGGSGVVFPKITARSSTGFTVALYDADGVTLKAGTVSWRAEGY